MPDQSRVHRFQVGDRVTYRDESEWPPIHMEGDVVSFENEELTYMKVKFDTIDGKKKEKTLVLTEDDVRRS